MIIALDKDRNRLHIENAVSRQDCYCPCCGEPLIQRRGELRRHHFAHFPGKVCTDSWEGTYDMSDWHCDWQSRFPKENQEIVLALGEIRHRADVLIGRTVIEFQRSNLSVKAFQDRNSFYTNLGYKVIWVFDLTEHFASGRLYCDTDERTFHWTRPNNAFRVFQLKTGQTEIFFQIRDAEENCLVKVAGLSSGGFEQFTVSGWYGKGEFLAYLGVRDGLCPAPLYEGRTPNEEYVAFREKYGITLNVQQERAVQAVEGANLLLAVPGSGKTTVLVARMGYMILCRKIPPEKILAMTFSRQAAKDMHSRFCAVFGGELGKRVQFRTIHSVAYGILRTYAQMGGNPVPELVTDNKRLIADILRKQQEDHVSDSEIDEAIAAITNIKNLSLNAEQIETQGFATPNVAKVYEQYQAVLKAQHRMDFDDQVSHALRILRVRSDILELYRERYPYICVDEAQDTSKSQHELLKLLVGDRGNVFMVGDEDQSIYRFRGAYPQALLDFKDTYRNPYILWMETNYRSTPQIVDAAAAFIEKNQNRYPKHMTACRGSGVSIQRVEAASRSEQYQHLLKVAAERPADTSILYRENDSAIPLINLFWKNRIPFRCAKREFRLFTCKVTRDVRAFLEFRLNGKNVEAFRQICYKGGFYLDKKTVSIACVKVRKENITFAQALLEQARKFDKIKANAEAFARYCRVTETMNAGTFLRYLDSNGYGAYMQKNQMDRNAFELLLELAADDPPVPDFLRHLDELEERLRQSSDDPEGVILSTVHSSKGLEYDTVYVMDLYDGRFPGASEVGGRLHDMDTGQEERRLFYVAMTRAKNRLILLTIKGRESSFAEEILPLPKPQHPKPQSAPRLPEPSYEQRLAKRSAEAAEALRKKREEERVAREKEKARRYRQGLEEVKGRSFQENEIIQDSFGNRWVKCDQCGVIDLSETFSWVGIRRDTPSLGRCRICVRKMS